MNSQGLGPYRAPKPGATFSNYCKSQMKMKHRNVEIKLSGRWHLVLRYSQVCQTLSKQSKFLQDSVYSVAFLELPPPRRNWVSMNTLPLQPRTKPQFSLKHSELDNRGALLSCVIRKFAM